VSFDDKEVGKNEENKKRGERKETFPTKIHLTQKKPDPSNPSSLLSPNHSALSSTIPSRFTQNTIESVEISLYYDLKKDVGRLMKEFTGKFEGPGLRVGEAEVFLNTFLGISQSTPSVKKTMFKWKDGRFIKALGAFTADLRWFIAVTSNLKESASLDDDASWGNMDRVHTLTPKQKGGEPRATTPEQKRGDASSALFKLADDCGAQGKFFKAYPSAKHLSCRRMALLLLNFVCTEPENKEGLIELGILDLALKQILLEQNNVPLALIVTNLSLLSDVRKIELLAHNNLQILETVIYALKMLSVQLSEADNILENSPLIQATVKRFLEKEHKKSVTNLTVVSTDLTFAFELGGSKTFVFEDDPPLISRKKSDESDVSDASNGSEKSSLSKDFDYVSRRLYGTLISSFSKIDETLGTSFCEKVDPTMSLTTASLRSIDEQHSVTDISITAMGAAATIKSGKRGENKQYESDTSYSMTEGGAILVQDKITGKMLLKAQERNFAACNSKRDEGNNAPSANGVAMSWYVAVLRNLTRFDEPEQVPVEIVSKLSKIFVDNDMARTLTGLIYPNLRSIKNTLVSINKASDEVMRYAENEWGLNSVSDHALDTFVNLSAFDEFRSFLRKEHVHIHLFKIFLICQERFDVNAIRSKPTSDPHWTNTTGNLVMTGIKAKIVTSLLTRSVVTYEFGINLTTKTKKLGKKDGGWGVIKKVANRVEKGSTIAPRNIIIDNSTAQILNTILFKVVSTTYPTPNKPGDSRNAKIAPPHDVTISGILRCIRTLVSRNHKLFATPKLYGGDLYLMLVKIIAKRALLWKDGKVAKPSISDSLFNDAVFCLFALSFDNLEKGQVPEPLVREFNGGGSILGLVLFSASSLPNIDHKANYQLQFLMSLIPTIKKIDGGGQGSGGQFLGRLRISQSADVFTETCAELQGEMKSLSFSFATYVKALSTKQIQEDTELKVDWDHKQLPLSEIINIWQKPVMSKPVEDGGIRARESEMNVTMYSSPFTAALEYSNGNEMCSSSFHTADTPVLSIARNIAVAACNPLFVVYGKQWKWISCDDYDTLLQLEITNYVGTKEDEF